MAVKHLTPQQVLEILQENHRQMSSVGEAIGCLSLDMDSTVEDWRDAMMWDYFKWQDAGEWFNWFFETDISDETWRELLNPTETKMLAPICECLAAQAVTPVVEPFSVLGRRCKMAGVFLVLRSQFENRGIDVSGLRPSTPLEPFLINHLEHCYPELIKLGAGRIPEFKIPLSLPDRCCHWGLFICMAAGIVFAILDWWTDREYMLPSIGTVAVIVIGVFLLFGSFLGSLMKPHRIHFGDLRDFRDLCRVLAGPSTASLPSQ